MHYRGGGAQRGASLARFMTNGRRLLSGIALQRVANLITPTDRECQSGLRLNAAGAAVAERTILTRVSHVAG